ncbi:MAG: type II secretion system protein [Eubacteriales bacterium]|nr:type II secretion system protein [Eubacteriales bacterium]
MKFKSLKMNKKGFTLVEMIVVLAIIAIMMAVTIPSFTKYINTTQEKMTQLENDKKALETKLDEALTDANITIPTED